MKFLRRLYDWVLHWAETPYGTPALFFLAVAEASFFPIPPDVLLMALSLGAPRRALKFALVCTAGSVLGGLLGYYIGFAFWEVGQGILFKYIEPAAFDGIKQYFHQYEAWAIAIAGFTPIPYKVFTITAGFMQANLIVFFVASILSRGARFFIVAGMIYFYGPSIKSFIDKYFNLLTMVFMVLLIGGFVVIKYVM